MSAPKHTPGPWWLGVSGRPEDGPRPLDYTGPGYFDNPAIFGADGTEIVGCDEYDVLGKPEDRALIVAAPELLEALRNLVAWHEQSDQGSIWGQLAKIGELYADASAAIAKAEGK